MSVKPWLTSDQLIAAVKRKISFPTSSDTFTDEDILAFANEEMMISQVPSVLQFHEEFFVASVMYPLRQDTNRYPVPKRAIGMKLRDVFWTDAQGNLFEMTRIQADDRAFFQRSVGANNTINKFYLEGNDIVLTPSPTNSPSGMLVIYYFLRPNQLVTDDRAGIIESFGQSVTVDNNTLVPGTTLTIQFVDQNIYSQPTTPVANMGSSPHTPNEFQDIQIYSNRPTVSTTILTAVSGSPSDNEFQIGATSLLTASNLASAITTALSDLTASSGNPASETVTITYFNINAKFTATGAGLTVNNTTVITCDTIPSHIVNGTKIDFIQTDAGHQTLALDVQIPANAISGNSITLSSTVISPNLTVGDYLCAAQECIIPQIPSDLHNGLAERTSARILAAIGDQQGLQAAQGKISEIEQRQGTLLDQRVEGAPLKVTGRHGTLRYLKMGSWWRY